MAEKEKKEKIFSCIKNNNLRQAKLLLDAGCNVNVRDATGRTPLMTSLVHIHNAETRLRLIQLLIQAGADVNAIDKNRKTALIYACTLNQVEIVQCLLKQPALDPSVGDRDGATALMHAVALGHFKVTKTMMEYNRSASVTIDMNAQDDNGHTVMDHAKNSKDMNNSKLRQQATSVNSEKIKSLLESYHESVSSVESSPKKVITPNEGIELVDMSHVNKGKKKKGGPAFEQDPTQLKHVPQNSSTQEESSIDPGSNIREWAEDLKGQYEESGRMSSLLTTPSSAGRPASRLGTGKGSSALDRATPTNAMTQSSLKSASDKSSQRHLTVGNVNLSPSDDEDEDISLQSLSDLVGTVRQYAQEIREIYAPIQKEEEERIKRRNERNERRKQKALVKQASVKSDSHATGTIQQEVTVEIHKIESDSKKADRHKPQGPSHSRSHDPTSGLPLASLHVENEQLSSTWPRGRQRPRSRDRYRHDMHIHAKEMNGSRIPNLHGSTSSIASAPNPGTFTRPRIPSDWHGENSLQQERDILNKAFRKLVKNNDDPLLTALNQNKKNFKLQEQVASSRQSVIQFGKSHQQTAKKAEVPSISVIPPPGGDFGHGTSAPKDKGGSFYGDSVLPSEDSDYRSTAERHGRVTEKKSNKSGLRRRKSVDQGLGHNAFLDKY